MPLSSVDIAYIILTRLSLHKFGDDLKPIRVRSFAIKMRRETQSARITERHIMRILSAVKM